MKRFEAKKEYNMHPLPESSRKEKYWVHVRNNYSRLKVHIFEKD